MPTFRNYLFGTFVSEIGNQMQVVAVAWQVYEITRNPAALGLIGLANFMPILLFSLIGGLAADKLNRKKLLIVSQISLGVLAFMLFFLTSMHLIVPWMIYLILVMISIASSFSLPARQAVLPNLVPYDFLGPQKHHPPDDYAGSFKRQNGFHYENFLPGRTAARGY